VMSVWIEVTFRSFWSQVPTPYGKAISRDSGTCLLNNSRVINPIDFIFGISVDVICRIVCADFCVMGFSVGLCRTTASSNTLCC
jgi:hypothetical protein